MLVISLMLFVSAIGILWGYRYKAEVASEYPNVVCTPYYETYGSNL